MFLLKKVVRGILLSITVILLLWNIKATAEDNPQKILDIRNIDNFDALKGWETVEAPGAELKLEAARGTKGTSMCLNYDLGEKTSYVVIGREIELILPRDYEFTIYIKRDRSDNMLEFKLIDDKGNTFWKKWYEFGSVNKWKKIVIRKSDLSFAWGLNPGAKLNKVKKIEFAVSEGTGKGRVCVDELTLTALPETGVSVERASVVSKSYYPRWVSNQEAYWTLVGVPEDDNEALICEDGTIEPYKRGFTIAPFLYLDNKLITRDEAKVTQSLEKGYLPIPAVQWEYNNVVMGLKIFAYGKVSASSAYVWYTVKNNRQEEVSGKMFLAVDPYQVYPPWQGGGGGISLIKDINYSKGILVVNGKNKIYPLTKPDNFGAQAEADSSPEGNIIDFIKKGILPERQQVKDEGGFVSAAIEYDFSLKPKEEKNFFLVLPLYDNNPDLSMGMEEEKLKQIFEDRIKEVSAFWEEKVNRVAIDIPEAEMINTLKSNIAYNLITKDGPAFEPGSRCYDKAWMRDGGIAAVTLLRVGLTREPREFIDWFSGYQFETGEVPPIIDTKAKDPLWEEKERGLIEYDSQGEFIWVVAQYYRFAKDKKFLEEKLPNVIKALEFLVTLRDRRLTAEFKDGPAEKKIFYGILPESTSHEGYDRKHSYWDDFWALQGWKSARYIARELQRDDLVNWMDKGYAELKGSVYDSINLVMKLKKIDYIPGCAELGDWDATSTAVAIDYCDELVNLPQPQLQNTFDKYYREIKGRFRPGAEYRFTPYEIRSVPALLYMGQNERALELLRFLLTCRRPLAWNHLAEVVHSNYRFPTYIGDMPHTWVGAEYINAVRSLFVYEKDDKLILGHGIDEQWLSRKEGLSVSNMPTYYGAINYSVKKEGDALRIKVWGEKVTMPPNGLVFKLPLTEEIKEITLNGEKLKGFSDKEITFFKLPVEVVVYYP